ncbi:MAG: hypothetical protein HY078_02440 [Elusimicrobia bacterium]|nr:hypothetical protein [Elusimicrobiota bacterium]
MRKLLLAAVIGLGASGARAADAVKPAPDAKKAANWESLKSWFVHFKQGLESTGAERAYQRKNVSITAVAAVRGGGQKLDDPNKPYIRGKLDSKQDAAQKKERAELDAAIGLVLAGKPDDGLSKLDEFIAAHPKSVYADDAKTAVEKVKQLKAEQPPASASAATPSSETKQ